MWAVLVSTLAATLGQFSEQLVIQDPSLLREIAQVRVATTDPIQVRIYPHLANYLPELRDLDSTQVAMTSTSNCNVYTADSKQPVSTGTLVSSESTFSFVANRMDQAYWIECADPLKIVRGPAAKISSYSYTGPFYVHAISLPAITEVDGVAFAARKVVEVVEVVPVETYLRGVVASEMPHTWPLESLKSQAIAARTYALFHMKLSRAQGNIFYDVDDTTLFQAFTGVNGQTPETDQAIQATADQIITYQGDVIQASFSASSGGYTEDASAVWPGMSAPYCQAKPEVFVDPNLDNGNYAPWKVTLTLSKIGDELSARKYIPTTSPISKIEIQDGEVDVSGRARLVHLTFQSGDTFDLSAISFQLCLGLRSTLMTFSQTDSSLVISGKGFGHGAGMSQYGAQVLAQTMNWNAQEILNFYYTDVEVGGPSVNSTY